MANQPDAPPIDEMIGMMEEGLWTRRRFLRASAAAALAVGGGQLLTACRPLVRRSDGPKVIVVGAGVAGLHAAYRMKKAGLRAEVYEGAGRTGGRIYTAKDILATGLTTELGGEFINSDHLDMLDLAKEFGLPLIDVQGPGEKSLVREDYFFAGSRRTEAQAVQAFRPIAAKILLDAQKLPGLAGEKSSPEAAALDKTPLSLYLDRVCGGPGWMRTLLDVAYTTEYGLDTAEQSAINMLVMISTDLSHGKFEVLGDSDERYKVKGGNQRIVDALAGQLKDQIHLEHRLEAIRHQGAGFSLSFQGPGGTVNVQGDFVLLAVPFSVLREVDLQVALPPLKQRAIAELGYGTNAKVMAGFKNRVWRDLGFSGNVFGDAGFQLAWDNSRLQDGAAGGLTYYLGGRIGAESDRPRPADIAAKLTEAVDKIYPGCAAAKNGAAHRYHWPTSPWAKGSYSCYKPGQWTSLNGVEGEPVGQLYFAGEHCSLDFAGFMNGGAATGRIAADAILAKAGTAWEMRRLLQIPA